MVQVQLLSWFPASGRSGANFRLMRGDGEGLPFIRFRQSFPFPGKRNSADIMALFRARTAARARFRKRTFVTTKRRQGEARAALHSRNRTSVGQMARNSNTFPITTENDAREVYRRKPMPRARRGRWAKFVNKVKHVATTLQGSKFQVILRNDAVTTAPNKQGSTTIHTAMGLNGSAFTGDVSKIFDRALSITTALKDNLKVVVKGWMVETQVKNIGPNDAYIDMYYWRAKKAIPVAIADVGSAWGNGLSDLAGNFPLGGSTLDQADYGVTPFQSPGFSKTIRVWKKIRVKLSPGATTQIEQRSGRNYYRAWTHDEDYSMDRCTEGILMVFYGTPSGANPTADPVTLAFSTNANYTWKMIESATNSGGTTQL